MKILIIGGTGVISTDVVKRFVSQGSEVAVINRGSRTGALPEGVESIVADINDEAAVGQAIQGRHFDVVADFIAYLPSDVSRDIRLFSGRTEQYIFVSTEAVYQKPPKSFPVNEDTPQDNPYWEYARRKIACEKLLREEREKTGFPVTIVRPGHTYSDRSVALGIHGGMGAWQNLKRIYDRRPVIIHGDGSSLWTVTHSRDFAVGFCGLAGNKNAIGESYNITGDEVHCWTDIYGFAAAALGRELNPFYVSSAYLAASAYFDARGSLLGDKAYCGIFDNSKLKKLVPEFKTTVKLEEGMRESVLNVFSGDPLLKKEDAKFDAWCDAVIETLKNPIKF